MEANKWDSEVKKKGTQIDKKKVPSLLIGEQHVDCSAITWSAARISGLAWPRAPKSSGSADANSSALVGVVNGEVVDKEGEGGDVVGRIEDSGISSVSLRDGVCSWLAKIVFLRTIFSDFGVCTTGLKESSEDFAGDGLKVSAWRFLLTFLPVPEGSKSRGFRFPPVALLPLFISGPDDVAMTFSPWPSSRGPSGPYFPKDDCQKLFFRVKFWVHTKPKNRVIATNQSALPTHFINLTKT